MSMRIIDDSEISSQQNILFYGNNSLKGNQPERFLRISTGFNLLQCNIKTRNNHLGAFSSAFKCTISPKLHF